MVGHLRLNSTPFVLYYLYRGKSVQFDHLRPPRPNTPPLYTATYRTSFDALSSVVSVYALFDLMLKGRFGVMPHVRQTFGTQLPPP